MARPLPIGSSSPTSQRRTLPATDGSRRARRKSKPGGPAGAAAAGAASGAAVASSTGAGPDPGSAFAPASEVAAAAAAGSGWPLLADAGDGPFRERGEGASQGALPSSQAGSAAIAASAVMMMILILGTPRPARSSRAPSRTRP